MSLTIARQRTKKKLKKINHIDDSLCSHENSNHLSPIAHHPHPSHQDKRQELRLATSYNVQLQTPSLDQIATTLAWKDSVGLAAAYYTEVKIYIGTAYTSHRNTRHTTGSKPSHVLEAVHDQSHTLYRDQAHRSEEEKKTEEGMYVSFYPFHFPHMFQKHLEANFHATAASHAASIGFFSLKN